MIGLDNGERPLLRAYSIASANYEDEIEFFSVKVADGPLTSRLQKLQVGDQILVSRKPTGTLVADNVLAGKRLYLLATGTGLAPFISIIKDPDIYEKFSQIVLVHGVRHVSELAYKDFIRHELTHNELLGEQVSRQLLYYPTVTREPFEHQGRISTLLTSGKLLLDLGLPKPNIADDRFMVCGSPAMLKDLTAILNERGFRESRHGEYHQYVIERAFVEH